LAIPEDKVVRFEAVNGLNHKFSNSELDMFKNVNYSYMPTKLQIMGNQLSHFKIFQEMIERNYKYIIVCQDDIVFKDRFTSYIDELMTNIPHDAEIIHFGFHKYAVRDVFLPWDLSNTNYANEIAYKVVNKSVCQLVPDFNALYNSNNSTGYILTLNGAKKYIQHVLENGFKYATDCDMNEYLINKNIYYGTRHVLATTFPKFGSDVFENMYNNDTLSNPHKLTINNDFLNYADMYNWTNDLPADTNAKITFVELLSTFIKHTSCEILEIGTFVGTSVIGMLQYLPNARATTVDTWISYLEKECGTETNTNALELIEKNNVERIFYENLIKSGLREKVTAIKGDSAFVLINLLKQNKTYDFIYVDGSHKAIDCYTDCLLSWQMLNLNGIMAIDDYLYKISKTNEFENVQKGVEHFLEKIKGQYIILVNGYRLFIKKVVSEVNATDFLEMKYNYVCSTPSDINEHLPTLYKYALKCNSILELGVRGCVSSWAFLKGLQDNNNKKTDKSLFLNDIEECNISDLLNVSRDLNIVVDYKWINDLDLDFKEKTFDLTFIDTWHIYGQLKRELSKFSLLTKKYIILHDTTVDAIKGETIRLKMDSKKQSLESGYPIEEIECGLQKAINEFLFTNREWRVKEVFENNNGLTVLERIY
jgi:predicted O-methyltransferase YrrM/GR25 family glycosyltransferase involved in LPS biosynthesis